MISLRHFDQSLHMFNKLLLCLFCSIKNTPKDGLLHASEEFGGSIESIESITIWKPYSSLVLWLEIKVKGVISFGDKIMNNNKEWIKTTLQFMLPSICYWICGDVAMRDVLLHTEYGRDAQYITTAENRKLLNNKNIKATLSQFGS